MLDTENKLYLRFHGRIIDSLGIQMYQSPVAAVAELIANAWDANAHVVHVILPRAINEYSTITVRDDGDGMTFDQCQNFYLNVGRNRRIDDESDALRTSRPVLGRKGIGKFAGFGISELLEVDTISRETGERTAFQLDLADLRRSDYISTEPKEIPIIRREDSNQYEPRQHGTTITLKKLTLERTPNENRFAESMARRFLINQVADEFEVKINDISLPEDNALAGVEFDFPTDYKDDEYPDGMTIKDGFGCEAIGDDQIKWRIKFTQYPIDTEELQGVSVFCGIKVAQTAFFFNLSGGLDGQHGQQYVSGQIKADYLDNLTADTITTERQRINWELPQCKPLEEWGQKRVKSLLANWKKRRANEKIQKIERKLATFSSRLERLRSSERRTIVNALKNLARIETLSDEQFSNLSNGLLTAWEGGRLHELIQDVSEVSSMDEVDLLSLLVEAQVLNALHVAEAVKSKVEIINGLQERIQNREIENAVRNYIAVNPWLLSPEWETFKTETSINTLVSQAAATAKLDQDVDWKKRVDLVMSSGQQLLVVEFMRPGLAVDRDHINRYQEYIDILRSLIKGNTGLTFKEISGLLVADKLSRKPDFIDLLERLAQYDMKALEWEMLLARASAQWTEFLKILLARAPDDERLSRLRSLNIENDSADEKLDKKSRTSTANILFARH